MTRFLLVCVLLLATLQANEPSAYDFDNTYLFDANQTSFDENITLDENETPQEVISYYTQKVLYLNYKDIPPRVLKGEIFSVTLKTLATIKNYAYIRYDLINYKGVEPLNDIPYTAEGDKYNYDTFYFLATQGKIRLPDFNASIVTNEPIRYKSTLLKGQDLNVITLNPTKKYANIIANDFELVEYKTTSYDDKHNILIFIAEATNCDIKSLHLQNVYKQGIESIYQSIFDSRITYYAIIDKKIENFSFSYFNLKKNNFSVINIPIIVHDDSVTTQSDLKPKDQSRERLKMAIVAGVALFMFVLIILTKKYAYLVLIAVPVAYIVYISAPSKEVCIKKGAKIHLLPVNNGTIFETTSSRYFLQKEGSVKDFVKVKLKNEKIGWVKNEDICSY